MKFKFPGERAQFSPSNSSNILLGSEMPLADKMAWPTSSDGRSAMKAVNDGQRIKGNHEKASKSCESMWLWVRWNSMISQYSFSPGINAYSRRCHRLRWGAPFVYHFKMSWSLKLKSVRKNGWWLPLVLFVVLTAICLSVLFQTYYDPSIWHEAIPKTNLSSNHLSTSWNAHNVMGSTTHFFTSNWCGNSVINSMNHIWCMELERKHLPPTWASSKFQPFWVHPLKLLSPAPKCSLDFWGLVLRCCRWQHDMFFQAGFGGKWDSRCLFCFRSSQVSHLLVLLSFYLTFRMLKIPPGCGNRGVPFRKGAWVIRLMEEILHHQGCIKPCK